MAWLESVKFICSGNGVPWDKRRPNALSSISVNYDLDTSGLTFALAPKINHSCLAEFRTA